MITVEHIGTRRLLSRNHFVVETQQCILHVVVAAAAVAAFAVAAAVKYIKVQCCITMLLR
jgi:hypothetical protein